MVPLMQSELGSGSVEMEKKQFLLCARCPSSTLKQAHRTQPQDARGTDGISVWDTPYSISRA